MTLLFNSTMNLINLLSLGSFLTINLVNSDPYYLSSHYYSLFIQHDFKLILKENACNAFLLFVRDVFVF